MRVLSWVSLLCSVTALGLGLAALALASGWQVKLGDVGGWLSGLGVIFAAFIALGVAVHDNRLHRQAESREQLRLERGAVREAETVVISSGQSGQSSFNETHVSFGVLLHNQGERPVYAVKWRPPDILFIPLEGGWQRVAAAARVTNIPGREAQKRRSAGLPAEDADPFTLLAGEQCTVVVDADLASSPALRGRPYRAFDRVSYEDEDGNRIGWVYQSTATPSDLEARFDNLTGKWSIVDDNYPETVKDGLSELINKARP